MEARYVGADGAGVLILLHVLNGKIDEFEIVKFNEEGIQIRPEVAELEVERAEA